MNIEGVWNSTGTGSANDTNEELPVEAIERLTNMPDESICFIFHDVDMIPVSAMLLGSFNFWP